MGTKKVTVTLEDEQLEAVRRLVAKGDARSISGFVKHAVSVALDDVAGWRAMLDQALRETGGPLTKREVAWADRVLAGRPRGSKRKRKAA
jgi:Arc/MetJ-type ribon-helix-helix transcriptional regulator